MKLRASAKINRNLSVLGLRPDGYHELTTVFQSLVLHDTVHFDAAAEGLVISCSAPGVPLDERNLVWKAARLVWEASGRTGHPAGRAHIVKRIPAQGGLGGGSADGAAALVGWDRLWGVGLTEDQRRDLAPRLGADVPFFLVGGTALGLNRGDLLRPLSDLPPRWVVLVFPTFGVSTADAFKWWDEDACLHGAADPRVDEDRAPLAVFNDLEAAVGRRHPEILEVRGLLEQAGAEHAAMTGSGSTVFGLFPDEAEARDAASALAVPNGRRTLVTRTATRTEAGLR